MPFSEILSLRPARAGSHEEASTAPNIITSCAAGGFMVSPTATQEQSLFTTKINHLISVRVGQQAGRGAFNHFLPGAVQRQTLSKCLGGNAEPAILDWGVCLPPLGLGLLHGFPGRELVGLWARNGKTGPGQSRREGNHQLAQLCCLSCPSGSWSPTVKPTGQQSPCINVTLSRTRSFANQ